LIVRDTSHISGLRLGINPKLGSVEPNCAERPELYVLNVSRFAQ